MKSSDASATFEFNSYELKLISEALLRYADELMGLQENVGDYAQAMGATLGVMAQAVEDEDYLVESIRRTGEW